MMEALFFPGGRNAGDALPACVSEQTAWQSRGLVRSMCGVMERVVVGMCRRRGAAGSSVEELAFLSIRVLVGCSATGPAARALVKGMLPVRVRVTSTRVVVTGGHSLARFLQDASLCGGSSSSIITPLG